MSTPAHWLVLAQTPIAGGRVVTYRDTQSRGIVKYHTVIDHPLFWPVYTSQGNKRTSRGYKTREAALRGHDEVLRRRDLTTTQLEHAARAARGAGEGQ